MPDNENSSTTPYNENANIVVRPSMTDEEIRDAFRRAYFAGKDLIREDFSYFPAEKKTLESFKTYLNELHGTSDEQFRPRFERLRAQVVEEVAPKLMPESPGEPTVISKAYRVDQVDPEPTSQNVAHSESTP